MKTVKKIVMWLVVFIVFSILSLLAYVKLALPNVGAAPEMTVERTPERIERGKYLANYVTVCVDCHSKRDWSRFSGPPIDGTFGMGGDVFDQKYGFPGAYYAKNITAEGISRYTDGELFRAITTGVNKEGKAMFPIMPFSYYGQMDPEDIRCIIAYIRSLAPIKNEVPESESDFPMNFIINTIPAPGKPVKRPEPGDVIAYGKYMTTAAGCKECHTKFDKGKLVEGTDFGGGREFPLPGGATLRSSNITPDAETGIGSWDAKRFVALFKSRSDSATLARKLAPGDFNTFMPWTMYGKMTDEDLKAIYAYLMTLKPINNSVERYTASH